MSMSESEAIALLRMNLAVEDLVEHTYQPTVEEVADALDSAADYLEEHGWVQQSYVDSRTQEACAVGAIRQACDMFNPVLKNHARRREMQWAICRATKFAFRDHIGLADDIERWNDAPGRTKQEVLDAFREAAKAERKRLDDAS